MSTSRMAGVAAIMMAVAGFEAVAQSGAKIVDGISVQTIQIAAGKNMHFIKVSLDRFDVRVLSPSLNWTEGYSRDPDRMARGFYLEDYKRRFNAVAVQAGGYIDSYSPPTSLGLVKSNGQIVSRQRDSWLTEAALCSDPGSVKIDLVDIVRSPSVIAYKPAHCC